MRTKIIFTLLCSLFLLSCKQKNEDKVLQTKIEKGKFEDILVDIHIAEVLVEHKNYVDSDSLYLRTKANTHQILRNYHVSEADYEQTYSYYLQNPDDFNVVYDEVIAKLTKISTIKK